jgi:copper chaperone NosL
MQNLFWVKNSRHLSCVLAIVFLSNCSSKPKPEPIHIGEDMCAHCRMAIIEPQFAAEIVWSSGEVSKYDDLICLAKGVKSSENANIQQIFLQDYLTREWVSRDQALVVKASAVQTPMGSGSVVFANREAAQKFLAEHGGQMMSLQEFLQQ